MVEMGGASTQIANFENNGDVMANLFKLQLGGSRHWNVYVHSYLYFGINGAWSILNAYINWEGSNVNPCLPLGSSVDFDSWMHMNDKAQFYPRSHPKSVPYSVTMVNNGTAFDFKDCARHTKELLRKRTNHDWCDFQMDGNCGFAGIYQPPMPKVKSPGEKFIATSNFFDVYQFLRLKEKSYVHEIGTAAEYVCNLSWEELKVYNSENEKPISTDLTLAQMCFRSVFVYQLLRDGWEFGDDYKMTAVDVINGQKLGWALGCMLYEINTRKSKPRRFWNRLLVQTREEHINSKEFISNNFVYFLAPYKVPWKFHPEFIDLGPNKIVIAAYVIIGTLVGSAIGFIIAMRFSKSFNYKFTHSALFYEHPELYQNPVVRKSLSISDQMPDVDEPDEIKRNNESKEAEPRSERTTLL